jgi:hypothetical protein
MVLARRSMIAEREGRVAMSPWGWAGRFAVGIAMLAIVLAPSSAVAAEPPNGEAAPAPGAPPPGPPLECYDKALTGSGPSFTSSRGESEKAAKENWLTKAKELMAEATWETAKDRNVSCAVQGLYSKCFATAVPCRPKDGAAAESPKSE